MTSSAVYKKISLNTTIGELKEKIGKANMRRMVLKHPFVNAR